MHVNSVQIPICEAIWSRTDFEKTLETGMLTTVGPGIYRPGVGGIGLENINRVTEHGGKRLGTLPTSLEAALIT